LAHWGDYQNLIYGAGLRGVLPRLPVDFAGLEARAAAAMPAQLLTYVRGGCGDEWTQDLNAAAFRHWGMVPRMMVDCSRRDTGLRLFGRDWPAPLFLAPIGVTGLATPDGHGDLHAARGAAEIGVPFCASTLGNDPLESVREACGRGPAMFQLYTPRNRALAESLIARAEAAGYDALVVTLDTWVTGWRPRDLNTGNFPQLRGHVLTNYFSDPVFRGLLPRPPEEDPAAAVVAWAGVFGQVLTWDDVAWLKGATRLPLVLKGICHPDDARRAADLGADAIYCSNHGGRQANGGIAAVDMLPGVVEGAGGLPVLFDGGVRSGTDAVKALALGATAVGLGRPWFYGLALEGAAGVAHVLRCVLAEMDLLMAVNGWPTLDAVRGAGAQRVLQG